MSTRALLDARTIAEQCGADGCLVLISDRQHLSVADHWPPRPELAARLLIPVGFGVVGLVARSGVGTVLASDAPRDPAHRLLLGLDDGDTLARVCVPAPGIHGVVAGVVALHRSPDRPFGEAERDLAQRLADDLGPRLHAESLWRQAHEHRGERDQLISQAISAQEAERRRIAFDLHDGVSTALASMSFRLSAARLSVDELADSLTIDPAVAQAAAAARSELAAAGDLADLAYQQTRAAISGLHSLVLHDLGLEAALETLVQSFDDAVTEVELFVAPGIDVDRIPDHAAAALYRIAQEALANARRHADAQRIVLSLRQVGDSVILGCADDGVGFDPAARRAQRSERALDGSEHFGLSSIEERCALVGASLRIESVPGRGTTLLVELPFPA